MNRIGILITICLMLPLSSHAQQVRDTIIVTSDWKYEGQWPKGDGVLYHEYNGIYWGEFDEAMPVNCKQCDYYGEKYEGGFKEWKYEGFGIKYLKSGAVYEGEFSEGNMTGVAKLYADGIANSSIQQGVFSDGKIVQGKEVYISVDKLMTMKPRFSEMGLTDALKKYLTKGIEKTRGPLFQGGDMNQFSRWVNQNLRYPPTSKKNGETGRVRVSFVINEDGKISDVQIVESSSYSALDQEAVRVISSAPKFKPALLNGHNVAKQISFPVIFQLR